MQTRSCGVVKLRLYLIIPGAMFLIALVAFDFGYRAGVRKSSTQGSSPPATGRLADAALMKTLLAQDLDERRFAFPDVIEASTGHQLPGFRKGAQPAETILQAIRDAADETLAQFNTTPSPLATLRRINEASRLFEDALRERIDAHPDLFCTIPATAEGTEQRTGYPDLRIEHVASGTIAYLDPKLYEGKSRDSTLRSFYYTPRGESAKVREDAVHLLLGIAHDGQQGTWQFESWELIDLSVLTVRLKAEFQASNRDLYQEEAILLRSGSPGAPQISN